MIFFIVALPICLAFLAFASLVESSYFSLSSLELQRFQSSSRQRERLVGQLMKSPRDLLIIMLMINVVMNILIQNLFSSTFEQDNTLFFSVVVPLCVTLLLGEVIPKSVGLAYNKVLAQITAKFVFYLRVCFFPFRKLLLDITTRVSRVCFFFLRQEKKISERALEDALHTSDFRGILTASELRLLQGYFQLRNTTVREWMQPREEVQFFDVQDSLECLWNLVAEEKEKYVLVCEGTLDKVLGKVSFVQMFMHSPKDLGFVKSLVTPVLFFPEGLLARVALERMYMQNTSIAMVLDEYGSCSGLITLEALVRVVFGELLDRREQKKYVFAGANAIIASGKLELLELEDIFQVTLKSPANMVTIGGWLTEQIGHIPQVGTYFKSGSLFFHVLSATERFVERVYIRKGSQ